MRVRPPETTRLSFDRFSWNVILGTFIKICRQNSSLVNIWQRCQPLCMMNQVLLWSYLAEFFLKRGKFKTNLYRTPEHPFHAHTYITDNRAAWDNKTRHSHIGHAWSNITGGSGWGDIDAFPTACPIVFILSFVFTNLCLTFNLLKASGFFTYNQV
jgi:hypothetical protein